MTSSLRNFCRKRTISVSKDKSHLLPYVPKTLRKLFFHGKWNAKKYGITCQWRDRSQNRPDRIACPYPLGHCNCWQFRKFSTLYKLTVYDCYSSHHLSFMTSSLAVDDVIGSRWWRHHLSRPPTQKIAEKLCEQWNFAWKKLLITTVNYTTVCWLIMIRVRFWTYLIFLIILF